MQSFFEKAKKAIEKNQDMLNVLEEFDRTRKMRKISYKKRVNFTVDEGLFNEFRNYCKKKGISMSNRIESYIKKEITA